MEHVHQGLAVVQQGLEKVVVIGVPVGVLHIVVDPDPVDEPQGLLPRRLPGGIVLVKGVVEVVVQEGVHPDGVGPKLLDVSKPPQVGLLVDGIVRGEVARDAHTQVDAPDLKGS